MTTITASEARLPVEVFNAVVYNHERVEVKRLRGKASVYVISEEDMHKLEAMEDQMWAEKAQRAEASGFIGLEKSMDFLQGKLNAKT